MAERTTRRWLDIAVPVALVLGTAASRLPRLSRPDAFVFDEVYYALDAGDIVRRGVERGGVVHPPVSKWLIAGGIRAFGFTAFGWRAAALVCGCLVVLFTYLAARQIVAGHLLPALAGGLVALDGISFTTGRVAMIDVFVAVFVTAAMWFVLMAFRDPTNTRRVTLCQWGVAVSLGLGIATKWNAAFVLGACLVFFLLLHARTAAGERQGRALLKTIVILTVVPAAIYVATYSVWMLKIDKTWIAIQDCKQEQHCSYSIADRFLLLRDDQVRIYDFQRGLKSDNNSNAALAYEWATQNRPSTLFRKTCVPEFEAAPSDLSDHSCDGAAAGDITEIVAVANPVVWFAGLASGVLLLFWAVFRRNVTAMLLLAFLAVQWGPWLLDPISPWKLQDRYAYSFYITPIIPVLALMTTAVLARPAFKWVRPVIAAATVAAFVFYWPIWVGKPMSPDQIQARHYWEAY
ncbi:MAG: dolichyl-phosphate-mannose-protein mannosyltransferase [Acidimicrobiaceae bacterium]